MPEIDWTKVKIIHDPSQIPPGTKQVHLYDVSNVLRPRGSMLKESVGLDLCEKLLNYYESWSNPKYADNPDQFTLIKTLKDNLIHETEAAFAVFLQCIETGKTPWELVYEQRDKNKNP